MTTPAIEVHLDLDGTLVDFIDGAMWQAARQVYSPEEWPAGVFALEDVLEMTSFRLWREIDRGADGFWGDLNAEPWLEDLIDGVAGRNGLVNPDQVHVISKPARHPELSLLMANSCAGKAEWIRTHLAGHLPDIEDRTHFTRRKAIAARPHCILVDDNPEEIAQWEASGGRGVLVPQPWNPLRDVFFGVGGDVAGYVLKQIHGEISRLQGGAETV